MLLDQGLSHSRIAAEVDVHVRTVERVSAELRSPREQRQFEGSAPDALAQTDDEEYETPTRKLSL